MSFMQILLLLLNYCCYMATLLKVNSVSDVNRTLVTAYLRIVSKKV